MKVFNKTNGFYLESKKGTPVDDEKTMEVIKKVIEQHGIKASYVSVNWNEKYIVPSADGVALSHIKCEFTNSIKTLSDADIVAPIVKKLDTSIKQTKIETTCSELKANIIGFVLQHAKLSIIAKGTKKNWGNIYSLHVNNSPKVKEALEYLTALTNEDQANRERKTCYRLTMFNEVYNALRSMGIEQDFLDKARSIRKGENWQTDLKGYLSEVEQNLKPENKEFFKLGQKGEILV